MPKKFIVQRNYLINITKNLKRVAELEKYIYDFDEATLAKDMSLDYVLFYENLASNKNQDSLLAQLNNLNMALNRLNCAEKLKLENIKNGSSLVCKRTDKFQINYIKKTNAILALLNKINTVNTKLNDSLNNQNQLEK